MLLASGSSVTAAMKLESVGIEYGNDDRQEWSLIGGKIHRESMTRRCKALLLEWTTSLDTSSRTLYGNGQLVWTPALGLYTGMDN